MDIMWNELSKYLGEKPKSYLENSRIELLNESVHKNYQAPIEDDYVVSHSGLLKDSIVQIINSDLERKFNSHWNPPSWLSENALVSYSHLKKDVKFFYNLDDDFYNQPFNGDIHVDYFGVKAGDTARSRKDIIIYDYKSSNDFIVQIKCRDSLDEIYFAKIPMESTLIDAYQRVLERLNSDKIELFNGGDVLKIPYIKFDTTINYTDIEGTSFSNELLDGKSFQHVSQRISFDLNQQGIKLESSAEGIIDFAEFDNPPPRILAFDKPFLIIMKRKNSDLPYFMYWVAGVEFMNSYIIKPRVINELETVLVGKWRMIESINQKGEHFKFSDQSWLEFHSDGTFEKIRNGYANAEGTWRYENNVISLLWSSSHEGKEMEWLLEEITEQKFVIGGKTKLVFEKE